MITSFQYYSRYLSSLYFQARELEKDFGYRGAPTERALKPLELRCLELYGQEVSGCKYNNFLLSNALM